MILFGGIDGNAITSQDNHPNERLQQYHGSIILHNSYVISREKVMSDLPVMGDLTSMLLILAAYFLLFITKIDTLSIALLSYPSSTTRVV